MWRALAPDPPLASQVLELLLEKINRDVPYKENKSFLRGSSAERVATVLPLSVSVPWGGGVRPPPAPTPGQPLSFPCSGACANRGLPV